MGDVDSHPHYKTSRTSSRIIPLTGTPFADRIHISCDLWILDSDSWVFGPIGIMFVYSQLADENAYNDTSNLTHLVYAVFSQLSMLFGWSFF